MNTDRMRMVEKRNSLGNDERTVIIKHFISLESSVKEAIATETYEFGKSWILSFFQDVVPKCYGVLANKILSKCLMTKRRTQWRL